MTEHLLVGEDSTVISWNLSLMDVRGYRRFVATYLNMNAQGLRRDNQPTEQPNSHFHGNTTNSEVSYWTWSRDGFIHFPLSKPTSLRHGRTRQLALTLLSPLIQIQSSAQPTDTFQMVIDNIWRQGKISETVYKYVQVCYLLPTDYKLMY